MKYLLTILFTFYSYIYICAQERNPFFDAEKLFTGGNLGLQFGTVTVLEIAPIIGYRVTKRLALGAGLTYQYINDSRYLPPISLNIYGGRIFTQFLFSENIYTHLEYEYLQYTADITYLGPSTIQLNNYLAGVGYRQAISDNVAIDILLLWNFNDSPYNLYSNPIIRGGLQIGL